VTTLICGLVGMSIFSKSPSKDKTIEYEMIETTSFKENDEGVRKRDRSKRGRLKKATNNSSNTNATPQLETRERTVQAPILQPLTTFEMQSLLDSKSDAYIQSSQDAETLEAKKSFSLFGLSKRQMGQLAAAFNGLWGGTNLIPLHFASKEGFGGPSYVVSFACGSMIVTIGLWVLRYLYEVYRLDGAVVKAFHALPSFYIRQMWFQGALSGMLYSLGNFMSILAVTFLGQGVGYSTTQCSMLVSGLWGIFKFDEIKGRQMITGWFFSALTAVVGIVWLSLEHK
jgi:hypothetical protein